jgi:DivIVA domain-containing protein
VRGERGLLRLGEYLVRRASRHLPAEIRDGRYREWAAELPAILHDPEIKLAARRAVSVSVPPDQMVTAADVEAVQFSTTRRGGYVEVEVDEALDYYAAGLDKLHG